MLVVKNLPANAGDVKDIKDVVPYLGLKDPLEEGMASHSSILAWRILWTEELGRLQSQRVPKRAKTWMKWWSVHTHTHTLSYKLPLSHEGPTFGLMLKENCTLIFSFIFFVLNCKHIISLTCMTYAPDFLNHYSFSNFSPWSFSSFHTDFQHKAMAFQRMKWCHL